MATDQPALVRDRVLLILFSAPFAIALFALLVTDRWEFSTRFAFSLPLSAMAFWLTVVRFPTSRPSQNHERPLFRRRDGNRTTTALPPGAVAIDDASHADTLADHVVFADHNVFATNRGASLVGGTLLGAAAWWTGASAGNTDAFGDPTDFAVASFVCCGWLIASAVRVAINALTASRALRVDREGLRLGPPLGFLPPLTIPASEIVAIVPRGSELLVCSDGPRLYAIDLASFRDPAAVGAALGVDLEPTAPSDQQDDPYVPPDLASPLPTTGPVRRVISPESVTAKRAAARPSAEQLNLVRRQWRTQFLVMVAITAIGATLTIASFGWWAGQRAANDAILVNGIAITATVTEVEAGGDSITVEFAHEGSQFERTIQAGLFKEFPRGLNGHDITVAFDPAKPDLVRQPGSRNMHPLAFISVALSIVVLAAGLLGARIRRRVTRLHKADRWVTTQFSVLSSERGRARPVELSLDHGPKLSFAGCAGVGKRSYFDATGLAAFDTRNVLILPSDGGRSVLVRARKGVLPPWS